MIYILLLSLIVLLLISLFVNKFNVISPWVISCAIYVVSTTFVIINKENWNITISSKTIFIILVALIAFGIGEIYSSHTYRKYNKKREVGILKKRINIAKKVNIIIYVFCFIILGLFYIKIKDIATKMGYIKGQNLMIQYARLGILNNNISLGYGLSLLTFVLRSLSYIYTFIYLYNKLLCERVKFFKDFHLMFPTICYLTQYSLSGSRGGIIEYISYFLAILFIFISKSRKNKMNNNFKIIKYSLGGLSIFFLIFLILGFLKGWDLNEAKSTLSLYTGGPILAFDRFLLENRGINDIFGKESLLGINHILYLLKIYSVDSTRALEFINIDTNYTINIYTALRRYINDFGYIGMIFIQVLLGFIFNTMQLYAINSRKINYLHILYPILFMALVYQSIDEQFFVSIFSITQVFTIAITILLYRVFIKKKININM